MPTRYMRPATHVVNRKPSTISAIDVASCQAGTPPNGMRIIMAMGDVNGISDSHTDSGLSGLLIMTDSAMANVKMSGNVTGIMNCWVSVSLSTAEPTAANSAL